MNRTLFIGHSFIPSEPRQIIVDVAQTGLTAEGKTFELTGKGHFPEKLETKGYKLSTAYVGRDAHCLSRFDDLFEEIKLCLEGRSPNSQVIIRTDSGYGSENTINKLLYSDL